MNQSDLERFAEIVKLRREDLGLTQDQMGDYGGPSTTTMTKVENAGDGVPAQVTLRKLDAALKWEPGSARRTLAGGEPTEIVEPAPPAPSRRNRFEDLSTSELIGLIRAAFAELRRRIPAIGGDDPQDWPQGFLDGLGDKPPPVGRSEYGDHRN